jgi:alpha/beta superfamily hydrolase
MKSERISFRNTVGFTLRAIVDTPESGELRACALFAHCFTCTKNLKAVVNISRALNEEGIAVMRFDFTGLGESEGEFADTNFSSNVADLVDAASFMEKNYRAPSILIGHSLGGAAAIKAAHVIASCRAVATIAAPADPRYVERAIASTMDEIEKRGEAEVSLAGRNFKIKKQFLEDIKQASMYDAIATLGRALIVFHSPADNVVGIDNAAGIFKAARHPKSFVSLDTADHLLSDERDSRYVGRVIAAWAGRYIE